MTLVVLAGVAAACNSVTVVPLGSGGLPTNGANAQPTAASSANAVAGHWTGTITYKGTITKSKHESGDNGQDPNSAYYATFDKTESESTSATDVFNIAATDGDVTYGIRAVKLGGTADNSGSTDVHNLETGHARNSSCAWDYQSGLDKSGSWTGSGKVHGEIDIVETGDYTISIRPDTSGPNGESAEGPLVPEHDWEKFSNLQPANCEVTEPPIDTTAPAPASLWWVSQQPEDTDMSNLEGKLDPTNPGSAIDGTRSWTFDVDGLTVTADWHLVHDSPIVLPHG